MSTQAGPSPPSQPGETDFAALMAAITSCQTALTTKIDYVQSDIGLIRRDLDSFRARITTVEQRVSDVEDRQRDQGADIHTLKVKVRHLEAKAEDMENRNRRNNLRILGLPEGEEGNNPVSFTEALLAKLLPQAQFSPFFSVERAHRMPPVRGPPGAPPRTFIFKLLHFKDRDAVLRAARAQGELLYDNTKLMIFPDYSVETQRQRKSFDTVRAKLRDCGLKYSMLFPARLRVQDGGSVKFFTSPAEAMAWIETYRK